MPANRRRYRPRLLGLSEVTLILLAIVSISTMFDQWHRFLELFSHFRLQYLAAAVVLCIIFLSYRKRGYLFIAATVLVLNASIVAPWFLGATATAATGNSFKLMHANVLATNSDSDRFIEWVDNEAPDILVLQELTPEWLTSIKSVAQRYPFLVLEPRPDAFGIGLFSQYALDDVEILTSDPFARPEIHATFTIGDRQLRLISVHAMPPIGESSYNARNLQLAAVSAAVTAASKPVVVIGDLNTSMWANHYRQLERTTGLQNARRGFGIEPSWPLFFPPAMIPIDHCLVSPEISVLNFRSGPNIGSDHLPIVTTLALASD